MYTTPFLAHATMEPMNCVAIVNGVSCKLISGSQSPTLDQLNAAKIVAEKIKKRAALILGMLLAGTLPVSATNAPHPPPPEGLHSAPVQPIPSTPGQVHEPDKVGQSQPPVTLEKTCTPSSFALNLM